MATDAIMLVAVLRRNRYRSVTCPDRRHAGPVDWRRTLSLPRAALADILS